jgi:hypothetical protein
MMSLLDKKMLDCMMGLHRRSLRSRLVLGRNLSSLFTGEGYMNLFGRQKKSSFGIDRAGSSIGLTGFCIDLVGFDIDLVGSDMLLPSLRQSHPQ